MPHHHHNSTPVRPVLSTAAMTSANVTNGSKPYIVEDRPMISRTSGDRVKITHTIEPGREETGCLTCFYAPPEHPGLARCPCFDYPEYVVNEMRASQYIYVRENSIEYNQPTLQHARSNTPLSTCLCCGRSPNVLVVRDRVTVVYFDDMIMDSSPRNNTRPCNPLHTFCCGGKGEELRLESRFCYGDMCYRGRTPDGDGCGSVCCCFCVPCVPAGCPECLCPCAARKTIYVEDAETAVRILGKARDDARMRMQVMER